MDFCSSILLIYVGTKNGWMMDSLASFSMAPLILLLDGEEMSDSNQGGNIIQQVLGV